MKVMWVKTENESFVKSQQRNAARERARAEIESPLVKLEKTSPEDSG